VKIRHIRAYPVVWDDPDGPGKIHESILRSFHIVRQVQYWLAEGVPANIILELVEELQERDDAE